MRFRRYLHEKNGTRMPLECIDIGVRSGDDIRIIDDALTLQLVSVASVALEPVRICSPGKPPPGTPTPPPPSWTFLSADWFARRVRWARKISSILCRPTVGSRSSTISRKLLYP